MYDQQKYKINSLHKRDLTLKLLRLKKAFSYTHGTTKNKTSCFNIIHDMQHLLEMFFFSSFKNRCIKI